MYTDYTSFEDVLKAAGVTLAEFEERTKNDSPDEKGYKKVKLIVETINGGWKPDWNNSHQLKYEIWWNMISNSISFDTVSDWDRLSTVGSRLCFGERKWAKHAADNFLNEFKEFLL